MYHVAFFNLMQVVASAYALRLGGAPERLAGIVLMAAAVATHFLYLQDAIPYLSIHVGVVAVDLCLLAVLVVLALYADRFWPIWMAALQMLGTIAHLAKAIEPGVVSTAYAVLVVVWSYPMLLILAAATLRHRQRLNDAGSDLDWSVR